jgi:hypothetical protein
MNPGVCETSPVFGVSELSVAVVASLVVTLVVMLALALVSRLVGNFSIAVAIGLAVVAIAIATLPFGLTTSNGTTFYSGISDRCRPPVVSAWHRERVGHFPRPEGWPSCVEPARHRLALGGVLIAVGALIVIVPRRRSARPSVSVPA